MDQGKEHLVMQASSKSSKLSDQGAESSKVQEKSGFSATLSWDKAERTNVIFTLFVWASIQRDWESGCPQVIKWE